MLDFFFSFFFFLLSFVVLADGWVGGVSAALKLAKMIQQDDNRARLTTAEKEYTPGRERRGGKNKVGVRRSEGHDPQRLLI